MKPRREARADLPQVRWRHGRRWRYGYLKGQTLEPDGSVRLYDNYNGGARSLPASSVQIEARGPRGGRRWEWIAPPQQPPVTETDQAPAWRPNGGRAELFNQLGLFMGAAA